MPSLSIADPFLVEVPRAALCAPVSHCQDKGYSQNLRAGLTWTCAAWVCWLIRTLTLAQQRASGAIFRPATKWSASRLVIVARLSLTVRCSLPCLLHEQYDAGLHIRIQEIRMSMHRGRKRNCIQGPRR